MQTVLRANALVKLFKSTADFSLKFKPLDLTEAGILIVTDASLGNVTKAGNVGDTLGAGLLAVCVLRSLCTACWPSGHFFAVAAAGSPSSTTAATGCSECADPPLRRNCWGWKRASRSLRP